MIVLRHYVLIFTLPAVSPALLPSACLPVTLLHTLVNEVTHTHTKTHRYGHTHTRTSSTACCMVWAADISLRAICQSELDALARTHTDLHTHSYMRILSVNVGFFFSPVYSIKHTCVLNFTLHNTSFPALTFCHLVIHVCDESESCHSLI